MLFQTMAECDIGLAAVAEPYRIPHNNGTGDLTGRVALIRRGTAGSPIINVIYKGQGFVVASWGGVVVVAVYISPNITMALYQEQLDKMRNSIAPLMTKEVLVMGDFNAKSTLWGSKRTDHRGRAVEDWAAELNLQLLNVGNASTCVRWQGESIVDLSWASPAANKKIRGWRVAEELETLSDHRYIFISTLPAR